MKIKAWLSTCALLIVGSSAATPAVASLGFCIEPRAPSTTFIMKPSKPYCYNGCSEFQANEYKRQVSTYYSSLRQYADDVDKYYKKAGEYIQCMADLD